MPEELYLLTGDDVRCPVVGGAANRLFQLTASTQETGDFGVRLFVEGAASTMTSNEQ